MSMRALTDIAVERDAGVSPPPRPRVARARAAAGAGPAQPAVPETTRTDVLVAAVPTEVLGPYTALVGLIVSTRDQPGESPLATLRWGVYAFGFVAIVLWLGASYVRERTPGKKRRFPLAEAIAALVAFGAWGLVMPGSPLAIEFAGDELSIATAVITTAGVFLVGLMTNQLRKPANAA